MSDGTPGHHANWDDGRILEAVVQPAPRFGPVPGIALACAVVGAVALALLFLAHPARAWGALLQAAWLWILAGIGCLVFTALHLVCSARWTTPLRQVLAGWSAALPCAALAVLVLALGGGAALYPWWEPEARHALVADPAKAAWLQPWRWAASSLLILALWWLGRWRLGVLGRQACAGLMVRSSQMRWGVGLLLLAGYGLTLLAWDLLLSLDQAWLSAIWGLYHLGGALQLAVALTVLSLVALSRGPLSGLVRGHTMHDLGTWMLGLACLWAYLAFVQWLIIAFANLDGEVAFLLRRSQHGYDRLLVVESILRSVLPFLLLLSQRSRTCPVCLGLAALVVVAGVCCDLVWLVLPHLVPAGRPRLGVVPELAVLLGALGLLALAAMGSWRRRGLLPVGDPDLLPSLNDRSGH